jgi:putative DNA methylase
VIPKECKRLAEVDFPIAVVSKHSAKEKSIRFGHPSTLHLWWARRPLGACRAMLLALLLPDPCDKHCPAEFKKQARNLLAQTQGHIDADDMGLRKAMLGFIGDFAAWEVSSNKMYLDVGRGLVSAAYGEEHPVVADPFAGGGSIPLEAMRIGCEAFASDLNPVACLINKVMLEDIPRYANAEFTFKRQSGDGNAKKKGKSGIAEEEIVVRGLGDALRYVGRQIKEAAEKELGDFYPLDPDGARPIAYLWARTVRCEAPGCGAEIPLVRSFWLCKKADRKLALRFTGVKKIKHGGAEHAQDDIGKAGTRLEPQFEVFEPPSEKDVATGTVNRAKATCLHCGTVMPPDRVRSQLTTQHGGADVIFDKEGRRCGGARLLTVVAIQPGHRGRQFRVSVARDYEPIWKALLRLKREDRERIGKAGLSPLPDEPIHTDNRGNFWVVAYGPTVFRDLFTSRQLLTNTVLCRAVERFTRDSLVLREFTALALSRRTDISNALCPWSVTAAQVVHLFSRQALPMMWDFGESCPLGQQAGDYNTTLETICRVIDSMPAMPHSGQTHLADAAHSTLPDESAHVWFTDPPYYDAIAYAGLSDFFYVWLKRALVDHPLLYDMDNSQATLTNKTRECIQDGTILANGRVKDAAFFEEGIATAFGEGVRVLRDDGIGAVVFAHKTTEGWEALLGGLVRARWTITASWPIATERPERLRTRESAALATSVHLVCRPRSENAPVGDWASVLRELPRRVADWMRRMEEEHVRGADLVFACIGPALEIFSRYSKVETAKGEEITLSVYLEKVWEEIGRAALKQVLGTDSPGDYGEDARLTALFLWTLRTTNGWSETNGNNGRTADNEEAGNGDESDSPRSVVARGYALPYDIVRRFSQPLGIHLEKWQGRLIELDKGVVRLLSVNERVSQLVEPGVAQDLALADLARKNKQAMPFLPFDELLKNTEQEQATAAKKRIEKETWSHLHLDSITTLDHIHKAMLFQKQGKTNALRELLFYEQHYRPEFLRVSNSLSALYPKDSEEKRLLDAMLLVLPK